MNAKLRSFYPILLVFFLFSSCKSQKHISSTGLEYNLMEHAFHGKKEFEFVFTKGIDDFMVFRKNFFQNVGTKRIKNANLIEIVNMFSDNIYSAYLQVGADVFIYEAYLSKDIIKIKKIDQQEFTQNKISYGSIACILTRMINNDLDDLLDDHITSNSHHSTYISSVDNLANIQTQILNDICF